MAGPVTVPGAHGTQVTITSGSGDALLLAEQIGRLLTDIQGTVSGASDLSVTEDTISGAIPPAPVVVSDEPTGTEAIVYRLYEAAFDRVPDAGGLSAWTAVLDSGHLSLAQVADAFANSAEFAGGMGQLSNLDFVRGLYQNLFDREPEGGAGQAWAGTLAAGATRGSLLLTFVQSQEATSGVHQTVEQKNDAEIYRLYEAAFGRSPDEAGEEGWAAWRAEGHASTELATKFVQSAEFAATASMDNSTFVDTMYVSALGRAAETDGKAGWVAAMNAGMTQAQVLLAFADSAEAQARWAHFVDDDRVLTNELLLNGAGGLNETVPAGYDYIVVNDAASDTLTASNAAIVAGTVGGTYFLSGNSTLAAAGGNNIVTASGNYELSFGDGNNLIEVSGSGLVSTGINGASTVFAAGVANTIQSNGVGDVVDALFGNTSVNEAGSNNIVTGVAGNLTVTVTGANDSVIGGSGATTVDATTGSNVFVQGGTGPLDFLGGAGGATILGGTSATTIFGAANSNITFSGTGDLSYTASLGSVTLNAAGSTGNVTLIGAGGNDSIVAGGGAETLDGGAGFNTFLFDHNNTNHNAIVITDSTQQIVNDTFNFTNYGGVDPVVTSTAGQPVVLTLTDNTTITFSNVTDPLIITTHNV